MDKVYGFGDLLKNSAKKLDIFTKLSSMDILINLLFALLVALFIFYIYRVTFRGVVYNYGFNLSLILMCLITATIIMTISSNVALSLGMVGALSIVRFRTAVKDPLDIMFLFWSISAGIAAGAGIYPILIVGSLVIGMVIIIFSKRKFTVKNYVLVIHYEDVAADEVMAVLKKIKYQLKSKSVTNNTTELTVSIKLPHENTKFVDELAGVNGVKNVVLVNYNGEYAQ